MTNLNDEKIRQELVRRYLNAETTLEEESQLADFLKKEDISLTPEEQDVLLLLQCSHLIKQCDITTEKAEEFDRLMQKSRGNRIGIVAMRWMALAAAAVICAVLLLPITHIDRVKNGQENVEPIMETKYDGGIRNEEIRSGVLCAAKKDERKKGECTSKHRIFHTKTRRQTTTSTLHHRTSNIRTEAPEAHDISTAELLETIHLLSGMNDNDIIITASSCNDGFMVKTANSNGPSSSYMLKRCPDGTSIELTSQSINF